MWQKWRPVLEGMATLEEIEKHWSLTDLTECNEILDYREYLKEKNATKPRRGRR